MDGTPVGRRIFLGMAALGAAGIVGGARAAGLLERVLAPITVKDGSGVLGLFPVGRFRIYSVAGSLPRRAEADWRLRLDGLVERPADFSFADLAALPATDLVRDFQCVTGWRVPEVRWKGVRLAELLARAGIAPGASTVRFRSFDGLYTETLSLDQARRDDVLVAYQMDGAPITAAHGGPVRLYVAPMYGYKSLKWLEAIEVTGAVESGYWEQRGYDTDAWIGRSNGRSDRPV
jgi:DMSO/TMAO reductase YedYZ molybdopterin-dependent catalytic subunit